MGIQPIFDKLSVGNIDESLLKLIKSSHETSHDRHVEQISSTREQIDHVFGQRIRTGPGVYRPGPGSSSVLFLRAFLPHRTGEPIGDLLEIGTGSGVIGLCLLSTGIVTRALLTDIDPQAVETAKGNIADAGLEQRCRVEKADIFDGLAERFDCIVFNLPLWHKPTAGENELSLADGDGRIARRFFDQAASHLNDGGEIWFSYANISYPELLSDFSSIWNFRLVIAEYVAETGMMKMVFRAALRQGANQSHAGRRKAVTCSEEL